jgi:lysophospholipase L1-like esterase
MKHISLILAACLAYLNIDGSDAEVAGTEKRKPGIYPVGDSTMANKSSGSSEYGWGMLFPDFLNPDSVQVFNNGFDGRSTKSFISEGKWNTVLNQLQEGDYG